MEELESIVILHPARQHQNGSLPLHHAVKDKQQEYRKRRINSSIHIITAEPKRNRK